MTYKPGCNCRNCKKEKGGSMKKSKQIRLLTKRVKELTRERKLQGVIIENQRQAAIELEQSIRAVRASQAEKATGSRDFGRGWAACMNDVEEALNQAAAKQRHPSNGVRIITDMELIDVSLDLHGDPHSTIRVIESSPGYSDTGTWKSSATYPNQARIDADDQHIISLTASNWVLQHPLSCRDAGTLFDCEVTKAAEAYEWNRMYFTPGQFPCSVAENGELVIDFGFDQGKVIPAVRKD